MKLQLLASAALAPLAAANGVASDAASVGGVVRAVSKAVAGADEAPASEDIAPSSDRGDRGRDTMRSSTAFLARSSNLLPSLPGPVVADEQQGADGSEANSIILENWYSQCDWDVFAPGSGGREKCAGTTLEANLVLDTTGQTCYVNPIEEAVGGHISWYVLDRSKDFGALSAYSIFLDPESPEAMAYVPKDCTPTGACSCDTIDPIRGKSWRPGVASCPGRNDTAGIACGAGNFWNRPLQPSCGIKSHFGSLWGESYCDIQASWYWAGPPTQPPTPAPTPTSTAALIHNKVSSATTTLAFMTATALAVLL